MEKGKWLSLFLRCLAHTCLAVVGFRQGVGGCDLISAHAHKERKEEKVMTGLLCGLVYYLKCKRTVHPIIKNISIYQYLPSRL